MPHAIKDFDFCLTTSPEPLKFHFIQYLKQIEEIMSEKGKNSVRYIYFMPAPQILEAVQH